MLTIHQSGKIIQGEDAGSYFLTLKFDESNSIEIDGSTRIAMNGGHVDLTGMVIYKITTRINEEGFIVLTVFTKYTTNPTSLPVEKT